MFDYETLRVLWWGLLGFLLMGFAVMDGFDMGAAALLPLVARKESERQIVLRSIEPVWEGNQVWLILGAGAVFAAWPDLYAVAFSGFYPAMFLALAALVIRPVAFKFRNKMPSARWRHFWDIGLVGSAMVPPVIFGVAFGNALQGVPFTMDNAMRIRYFGDLLGLLNPFGLFCGVISLGMIVMQGAAWLVLKTEGAVQTRARRAVLVAGVASVTLFVLAGFWVATGLEGFRIVGAVDANAPSNPLFKTVARGPGYWLDNYKRFPIALVAPCLAIVGLSLALLAMTTRQGVLGFIGSSLVACSVIGTAGVSMFPFLLPSSFNPSASLTVWDASSSRMTLEIMLVAALALMPVVLGYTAWVYHVLRGKVVEESPVQGSDSASY